MLEPLFEKSTKQTFSVFVVNEQYNIILQIETQIEVAALARKDVYFILFKGVVNMEYLMKFFSS